jgi:hypothetical protein
MLLQVEIVCNGEVTSSEQQEFQSPWRALGDTVEGCPPYDRLYHSKNVKVVDGWYTIEFPDGTIVRAKKL